MGLNGIYPGFTRIIAEVGACRFRIPATTFESPGSKSIIEEDGARSQKPEEADLTIYLTAPNAINTFKSQAARKLMRLYVPHDHINNILPLPQGWGTTYAYARLARKAFVYLTNPWCITNPLLCPGEFFESFSFKALELMGTANWTQRQHSIDNIVQQFDPISGEAKKFSLIISWPDVFTKTTLTMLSTLIPSGYDSVMSTDELIELYIQLIPGYKVEEALKISPNSAPIPTGSQGEKVKP